MASCPLPASSDGHVPRFQDRKTDMLLPCPGKWTCPTDPDCTEGHAHSSLRPVHTMASCPLPASSDGHVPRFRPGKRSMLIPGPGKWTCPTDPDCTELHRTAQNCTEGHAHSSVRPVRTMASCPLPASSDGHVPRFRDRRRDMLPPSPEKWTCSVGPGRIEGHAHPECREWGMSSGRGRAGGYRPPRSSKSTSSPLSSSSGPNSFRCRYNTRPPAAARAIPVTRKMIPPMRAAA